MKSINTMRGLLVGGAVFAALVAAFFGLWDVVAILGAGVAVHAGLWVYLHRVGVRPARGPEPPAAGAPQG